MRALITGAAQGLGRALTEKLLQEGYQVSGVDVDLAGLRALAENGPFCGLQADLADRAARANLVAGFSPHEPFDLVVLNAGISATGNFEELPCSAYEKLLCLNVETPMVMASKMMADGLIAKTGTMVFISSLSHATGYPGASVYAASKDAVAIYAKSIARVKNDVHVLTVFPGPIRTAHAERHAPKNADASKRMLPEKLAAHILNAVQRRSHVLYPGVLAKLAHLSGAILPGTMSGLMRRLIYENLDEAQY